MKYLYDIKLSLKAKGLLCYLLELNDNTITAKRLSNHLKESEKTVSTILKELVDKGYVIREQIRNDNGTWGNYKYNFYPEPQEKIFTTPKSKKIISDSFSDDKIIWYKNRLSVKLKEEITYKKMYELFEQYGEEKIKRYHNNIDKLNINIHAGLASFKLCMTKNVLDKDNNIKIGAVIKKYKYHTSYESNKKCEKCNSSMYYSRSIDNKIDYNGFICENDDCNHIVNEIIDWLSF